MIGPDGRGAEVKVEDATVINTPRTRERFLMNVYTPRYPHTSHIVASNLISRHGVGGSARPHEPLREAPSTSDAIAGASLGCSSLNLQEGELLIDDASRVVHLIPSGRMGRLGWRHMRQRDRFHELGPGSNITIAGTAWASLETPSRYTSNMCACK